AAEEEERNRLEREAERRRMQAEALRQSEREEERQRKAEEENRKRIEQEDLTRLRENLSHSSEPQTEPQSQDLLSARHFTSSVKRQLCVAGVVVIAILVAVIFSLKAPREDAVAYYRRGRALQEKKDFDGAIKDYSEAIRLNPNYASAYFMRAF